MYNEICPPNSAQHVVVEGDTLWKLSQSHGVSVQKIIDANPGVNVYNLQIGSNLCIPAGLSSPTSFHTCPDGTFLYTIHSGDTVWKLSQTYGVNVQDILDVNPGIDPQNLQIGSTLCIPSAHTVPAPSAKGAPPAKTAPMVETAPMTPGMPPVACPKGTFRYTIQSGDTVWKLSQIYGVSTQDILDVNPGIDPQNLQIGSTLCIPSAHTVPAPSAKGAPPAKTAPMVETAPMTPGMPPVACPKGTFRYTIQSGDTVWKLSQTYGVSTQDILDVNPGIDPQNLQIGSTLCIPTAKPAPAPSAKATPPAKAAPQAPAAPMAPKASMPPTVPQTKAVSSRHFSYCVKRCDTICGIARNFCVSVESIINVNPGMNPKCLQAGTYINVPINCCGENTWRYTVMTGDTLNRIANKLNVCPASITAANPNIDFEHLVHCQVICIPKE